VGECAVPEPLQGLFDRSDLSVERHLFPRKSLGALSNHGACALVVLGDDPSKAHRLSEGTIGPSVNGGDRW
jgi:hypothetical protein